jgi:hypothetical protein
MCGSSCRVLRIAKRITSLSSANKTLIFTNFHCVLRARWAGLLLTAWHEQSQRNVQLWTLRQNSANGRMTYKGLELRAVHQFKTLIGCSLPAMRTVNAQPAFMKLRPIWPQAVVEKVVGLWRYFAMNKIFVAIPTTECPVGHAFLLWAGTHGLNLLTSASHSHTHK